MLISVSVLFTISIVVFGFGFDFDLDFAFDFVLGLLLGIIFVRDETSFISKLFSSAEAVAVTFTISTEVGVGTMEPLRMVVRWRCTFLAIADHHVLEQCGLMRPLLLKLMTGGFEAYRRRIV
ncbi:uncharacterized protein HMPREF1120_03336 [Exophiala dermatitidis NIH/UT8656]|uniref:Uncharacterized protein n=1 Tax=Exophiala dermatitidis (strain ATCC 34100 / CBS 525.76 / NIH/UT8656) TaxID=858893 RepID=H6BW86_EXODN|nr:uncharacterized protein HMPREF1120_03336 [Exophiala dermatitidis NIH/UT8656]EHY55186.1 hypothetical protein HMPREF1120_03336 [Exophiala dermatitidis NIH/UT8656]